MKVWKTIFLMYFKFTLNWHCISFNYFTSLLRNVCLNSLTWLQSLLVSYPWLNFPCSFLLTCVLCLNYRALVNIPWPHHELYIIATLYTSLLIFLRLRMYLIFQPLTIEMILCHQSPIQIDAACPFMLVHFSLIWVSLFYYLHFCNTLYFN